MEVRVHGTESLDDRWTRAPPYGLVPGPAHEARILWAASKWEDFEGLCGPYNIVALVWSLLLNWGHLYSSGMWITARLCSWTDIKMTHVKMRLNYVLKIQTPFHLGLIGNIIVQGCVHVFGGGFKWILYVFVCVCVCVYIYNSSSLWSHVNFCMSTPILKLEMTVF
jgi:hypothetical protein